MPKSNVEFWTKKFAANVMRDTRNYEDLRELGWHVIVIWQCEAKNLECAKSAIVGKMLSSKGAKQLRKPTIPRC